MRRWFSLWVVCGILAACAGLSAADEDRPCQRLRHPGLSEGPVIVGFFSGDFATGRRACPRTEVSLGARLGVIIDTPGFYGNVSAVGILSGSLAIGARAEVFATLEFLDWEFVQNATLKGTALGLGQLTAGGSIIALERGDWVLTPYGRLLLPTSSLTPDVRTVGAEAGLAVAYRPPLHGKLDVHAVAGGDVTAGLSGAQALPRGGALLNAGLQYMPWTWLGLALDVNLHMGARAALDYVAPALGLRFRLWRTLGAELAAAAPVAGADRHLVLGALRLAYRF